jgi:hypothetical protein
MAAATAAHPATGTNTAPLSPIVSPPTVTKTGPAAPAATAPAAATTTVATTPAATSNRHHRRHGKLATPEPTVAGPGVVPVPPPVVPAPAAVSSTPASPPASSAIAVPTVQSGLPVARHGSGTTATLAPGLGHRNAPASVEKFPFIDYPAAITRPRTRNYPWKNGIITTVFWIGEGGSTLSATTNHASSWDVDWTYHNGGVDDPDEMSKKSGYSFDTHASTLNPFYIALPFNDLAYPEKAQRWLPSGWYKPQRHGEKAISACQGRWVEIKSNSGRVCYAQWEDVGPLVSDHAEYVFGPELPTTLTHAGLDVSPSVAKYLGFNSTALTSWRFVDDADVQPGMWLRYDEQAILFRALKEGVHPRSNPRMQDLDEPVPDGSMQDDSEKRAGAARG